MAITELECPHCGARLSGDDSRPVITCQYCQTTSHIDWRALERKRSMPAPTPAPRTVARPPKNLGVIIVVVGFVVPLVIGIVAFAISMTAATTATSIAAGALPELVGTPGSSGAASQEAPPPPLDPEQARILALDAKLEAYAGECLGRYADRAFASRSRYRSWVRDDEGPSPRSRHKYGLYSLSDPSSCVEAVESASALTPRVDVLDAAAADFAREIVALGRIVNEASRYYDRSDYEDDEMARGIEMHRPLLDAFDRFTAVTVALEVALDPVFDEVLAYRLAHLPETDVASRIRYDSMRTAFEIASTGNVHWRDLDDIDLEPFEEKVNGFERMVNELREHTGGSSELGGYVTAADKLALVAKQLVRRVRSHGGWSGGDRMILSSGAGGHWMVEGSPGAMIAAYDELAGTTASPRLRPIRPVALMTDGY
jgi:hypothetical protein